MSRRKGLMVVCDRCGTWDFREYVGVDSANARAERVVGAYEAPDEWESIDGIGDVCPNCAREYRLMIERFKNMLDVNEEAE